MTISRKSPVRRARRGIQSVGNAVKVLEALARVGEASGLGAISQASGMSTSQTHRYLASLVASGMARQDASSGRYDLGASAIMLGLAALARTDTLKAAETAISDFVHRTGRTVQLCALGPLGPTVVRWFSGVPPVVTSLSIGSVLPLLYSATGHVFLAFAANSEVAPLIERELAHDAVARVDIKALKEKVRKQGFASVSGTVVPDLRAAAFPIFDLQGRPVLSATVIGSRATEARSDPKIWAELGAICSEISKNLGGHAPGAGK